MLNLSIATANEIPATLKLHFRYHVDSIADSQKSSGFVTTPFTATELENLVKEQGLFIAVDDSLPMEERVVGYVMAASWQFWSAWPMFAYMIEQLEQDIYQGISLSVDNSYQYGPICIDQQYRGTGLVKTLFDFAKQQMAKRYPVLVTFVNQINQRSFEAHSRKLGLDVIDEFEYNHNRYYKMACLTSSS